MFARTWRKHWGLVEDPFAYEDADKDPILGRVEADAVHSAFDRVFGSVVAPGPGIVFGEKGSGKSGLRLAIRRRLGEDSGGKIFCVDYTEFDHYLDNLRIALRLPAGREKTAAEVAERVRLSDHLDAILSLGVTALVQAILDHKVDGRSLSEKQKIQIQALCALYHDARSRTASEALHGLRTALHVRPVRPAMLSFARICASIVAVALLVTPSILRLLEREDVLVGPPKLWWGAGALLLVGTWTWTLVSTSLLRRRASRALRAVRVLARDPLPLVSVLESLRPTVRKELVLPIASDEASRYELLAGFLQLVQALGWSSFYVLVDRVDESTLLGGKEDWIRQFVSRLLDHRLLQFPGLALKLFLPVELAPVYLGASPDELKRMRLDKSNTVQDLRWTGQELYEIANKRLRAVRSGEGPGGELRDYFRPEVDEPLLRDTLSELGTPRYAFGFFSELFAEWIRNLPDELPAEGPEWRIPRTHFEIVRASWTSRARVLRRALN